MITVENISKAFGDTKIIDQYSLTIPDGEFIVITGKSGSGKTTLLNMLGLLEKVDNGTITIDGKSKFTNQEKTLFYRKEAGYLFQNFALIDNESVYDNLKIALTYRDVPKKQWREKIEEVLSFVGLEGYTKKKIYQLSGGEQQRIALARIILKEPKYIYADEPTGNLDMENRNIVLEHLHKLKEKGCTVIVVTHDNDIANLDYINKHIKL